MARAATRAADSEQLRSHPDLSLRLGSYAYQLVTKDGKAIFSISDGTESTTKTLGWALGDGSFGQTYVYREQGKYYESQLSFYTHLNALDTTTGHMEPKNLETAAGGLRHQTAFASVLPVISQPAPPTIGLILSAQSWV